MEDNSVTSRITEPTGCAAAKAAVWVWEAAHGLGEKGQKRKEKKTSLFPASINTDHPNRLTD